MSLRITQNLGWNSSSSLLDFGEGANARDNVFNIRGNIDLKINDWIKTSVDGASVFVNDRGPRGNYWNDAADIWPHLYIPLLPIDLIDPENELLLARKNDVDGEYLLGGNSNYMNTPFGDGYSGGYEERIERNFSFNNRIDFDIVLDFTVSDGEHSYEANDVLVLRDRGVVLETYSPVVTN